MLYYLQFYSNLFLIPCSIAHLLFRQSLLHHYYLEMWPEIKYVFVFHFLFDLFTFACLTGKMLYSRAVSKAYKALFINANYEVMNQFKYNRNVHIVHDREQYNVIYIYKI